VLNGNIKLTGCVTRKLQKHKAALRKLCDRRVPVSKKKKLIVQRGDDEDDYDEDDNFVEDEARENGRENVGPVASHYMMPYVYKRRFLDTQYGVRKEGDMFMIGDYPVLVDTSGDISIKDGVFRGTEGLWKLLTRRNVNTEFVTKTI